MNDKEIEIQVNIENSQPLKEFLEKFAQFKGEKHQVDEYFNPPQRDFLSVRPINEWLRLRNSSGRHSFNYKNWHYEKDGKSFYCDEFETEIADLGQLKKILAALGFKPIVTVKKIRKTWVYKDYEIALDTVRNLGEFVEIEYLGKEKAKPREITEGMVAFLKQLNCGKIKINYLGYPCLLLVPEEAKYEIR